VHDVLHNNFIARSLCSLHPFFCKNNTTRSHASDGVYFATLQIYTSMLYIYSYNVYSGDHHIMRIYAHARTVGGEKMRK
jgi:hypothetical protein